MGGGKNQTDIQTDTHTTTHTHKYNDSPGVGSSLSEKHIVGDNMKHATYRQTCHPPLSLYLSETEYFIFVMAFVRKSIEDAFLFKHYQKLDIVQKGGWGKTIYEVFY